MTGLRRWLPLVLLFGGCSSQKDRSLCVAPCHDISPVSDKEFNRAFLKALTGCGWLAASDEEIFVCGASRTSPPSLKKTMAPGATVKAAIQGAGVVTPSFFEAAVWKADEGRFLRVKTRERMHLAPASACGMGDLLEGGDAVVVLEKMVCF